MKIQKKKNFLGWGGGGLVGVLGWGVGSALGRVGGQGRCE